MVTLILFHGVFGFYWMTSEFYPVGGLLIIEEAAMSVSLIAGPAKYWAKLSIQNIAEY